MKYKTVIYTSIRAEIEHDEEFGSKNAALTFIMENELLDYASILGSSTFDTNGVIRVTAVEVLDDDVTEYDVEYAEEE